METTQPRWALITRLPHGHKLFEETATGRIAIADNSGRTPDQTDDGPLYLDDAAFIEVTEFQKGFGESCLVPVTRANGEKAVTGMTFSNALEMAVRFDMTIVDHQGKKFCIRGLS